MKHFIAILGTLAIILLWFLPIITIKSIPEYIGNAWAVSYAPIAILTFVWGNTLYCFYKDK